MAKKKHSNLKEYLSDKEDFLKCVLLCHDCTKMELTDDKGAKKQVLTGSSLDEQCLLEALQVNKIAFFMERQVRKLHI